MASLEGEHQISINSQAAESVRRAESREGSAERKVSKDRDEKLKLARERQNEERLRKLEELRVQAEAAQRYREQKDEERRRRIEEARNRDTEKRQQVEERKRAIMEAEKERRDYILRKNQERDSRLETKKRERNSIAFAFGSSTPRLLEPSEFGMVSPSTFWGQRRSTSISNVAGATLSRRSSERELADSGSKKRATSASCADRNDGSRSGNVTPGGSISTSRPGSAMSTSTNVSTTGLLHRRPVTTTRKPRPASIAGTGLSLDEINKLKKEKPPAKSATSSITAAAQTTPKRNTNTMSTSMIVTSSSRLSSAEKKTPIKREQPSHTPKSTNPKPLSKTSSSDRLNKLSNSKEKSKDMPASMAKSAIVMPTAAATNGNSRSVSAEKILNLTPTPASAATATPLKNKEEKEASNIVKSVENSQEAVILLPVTTNSIELQSPVGSNNEEKMDEGTEKDNDVTETEAIAPVVPAAITASTTVADKSASRNGSKENSEARELTPPSDGIDMMTASMIAKSKITTEEEAKAALAERRRLAREEAERQAELERQRIEAERIAELKRQEEEAEQQRLFEEESTRLAEIQRKGEEERLRQAIEEAKQREEEELRKREEEEKQRAEREEAEKKAKEEAEKQRLEVAERLKREEKEREERRKRVEAIMSRTRRAGNGGGATGGTPNSTPVKDNKDTIKEGTDDAQTLQQQQQINSNSSESSSTSVNTTAANTPQQQQQQQQKEQLTTNIEPQNTQAMYEQAVIDKETALINNFSNMIIDENAKNLLQQQQHQPQQIVEVTNGKLLSDFSNDSGLILQNSTTAVANGNGHIENIHNKNNMNILQDVVAPAINNQLIDLSIESQDINNAVHFNNNNSLLTTTTTTTLVTADSHENKDISLL